VLSYGLYRRRSQEHITPIERIPDSPTRVRTTVRDVGATELGGASGSSVSAAALGFVEGNADALGGAGPFAAGRWPTILPDGRRGQLAATQRPLSRQT